MAKSTTTHVLEIETGIGEPAFIPLTLGTETQPISVGKKGMWRIESARVLDIHAFVYFDGNALFMQSADDESAATIDGYKIGKAWTELHAPCKIDIGAARLRFRSLLPESEEPVTAAIPVSRARAEMQATGPNLPPPAPRPPPPSAQSAPTMAEDQDERTPITRAHSSQQLPAIEGEAEAPTRHEGNARDAEPRSQRPSALPSSKPERPFRPGAFSQHDSDESTRFKPLDNTAARHSGPPSQMAAMQMTGPVQSMPSEYPPVGQAPMQPAQSMPPMMVHGSMPPVMQPPSMPPMGVPSGTMNISGSGVSHTMNTGPSGPTGPMQMPYGSGGYPSQPPTARAPAGNPLQQFVATFKSWNPVKKASMILLPIALLLGITTLFDDDAPPPVSKKLDAGAPIASNQLPEWPAGVPCPPPNWPPNTPLPCKPNNVVVVPTNQVVTNLVDASAPPPVPNGKLSLQRQAVDAVAQGDLPRAASLYEELARREPSVTVYAESARILRAKLDGGL